jgi:glycosyltransferase involved in cell wall biosynthesis
MQPASYHAEDLEEAAGSGVRLGIGVLAHNEASRLPVLIASLFEQSLFTGRASRCAAIRVACIANGCHDDTAAVAKQCLSDAVARLGDASITWTVDELATPGKANAWNHCVHDALADCDYLCFLDADIVFAGDDTIARALAVLLEDPRACVATDRPVKRIADGNKGWLAALSRYFSQAAPPGPTEICGQFYCARARILRSIWLPAGLPVEDGFLRAMVITDEFRQPEDPHRIARAELASHYFEAKTNLRALWRHKKRLMIGTTINHLLFRYLWEHAESQGAGQLLREQLQRDPDWLPRYLAEQSGRQAWVVPMGHVFRRLTDLRSTSFSTAARRAPAAAVATAVDLLAAVTANRTIKRNLGLGFW